MVKTVLIRALERDGMSVSFASLEALCLHYIDTPSVRTAWDNATVEVEEIVISKSYSSHVSPFLGEGESPR
jgi:hypothetical protein